jgi:hypothetical protein
VVRGDRVDAPGSGLARAGQAGQRTAPVALVEQKQGVVELELGAAGIGGAGGVDGGARAGEILAVVAGDGQLELGALEPGIAAQGLEQRLLGLGVATELDQAAAGQPVRAPVGRIRLRCPPRQRQGRGAVARVGQALCASPARRPRGER